MSSIFFFRLQPFANSCKTDRLKSSGYPRRIASG
jgi:hypothetical protein